MKKYIKSSKIENIYYNETERKDIAKIVFETEKILSKYKKFDYISFDFNDRAKNLYLYIELNEDYYKNLSEYDLDVELLFPYYTFDDMDTSDSAAIRKSASEFVHIVRYDLKYEIQRL